MEHTNKDTLQYITISNDTKVVLRRINHKFKLDKILKSKPLRYKFEDLEKHFTMPKNRHKIHKRIPRRLKKLVKSFCGSRWDRLTNGERLWYYLEHSNPDYKSFRIKVL